MKPVHKLTVFLAVFVLNLFICNFQPKNGSFMYQIFDHSIMVNRSFTIKLSGKGVGAKLVKKNTFYKQKELFPTFYCFSVDMEADAA